MGISLGSFCHHILIGPLSSQLSMHLGTLAHFALRTEYGIYFAINHKTTIGDLLLDIFTADFV
jgi:hypothetical protein